MAQPRPASRERAGVSGASRVGMVSALLAGRRPAGADMPTTLESVDMLPSWSGELANLYYRARSCRDRACKQRYWRRIAREKKRLLLGGVPYLELHLVTRCLARPGERSSEERLRSYRSQLPLF